MCYYYYYSNNTKREKDEMAFEGYIPLAEYVKEHEAEFKTAIKEIFNPKEILEIIYWDGDEDSVEVQCLNTWTCELTEEEKAEGWLESHDDTDTLELSGSTSDFKVYDAEFTLSYEEHKAWIRWCLTNCGHWCYQ